jgi:DNA-binding protein HU-beta
MTKADLVDAINEKTGIPKGDILVTLENLFREIKKSLVKGETVHFSGFGSFHLKRTSAKTGRNIRKQVTVAIPAGFRPTFKPAKEFKKTVKQSGHTRELSDSDHLA